MNEKLVRIIILLITAALHIVVIFFIVFETQTFLHEASENARVMKLVDLEELPPPPPAEPEIPKVEEIAEVMIETDVAPIQEVVAAGSIVSSNEAEEFLPAHLVSTTPQLDEEAIIADMLYPPIALRSGIEGRVILELFVDRSGTVQRVTIIREVPEGRGFGEAASRAFMGRKGFPATANGVPVSCRYRYPVSFTIK
ncbi:MAG: energy transducer TonB [Treponema sp.]|nr:energy transducer TonB [Treponema sp.]